MAQQRYVATIEMYVYAENKKEAIQQVNELCNQQKKENDNGAELITLTSAPFGSLKRETIYLK